MSILHTLTDCTRTWLLFSQLYVVLLVQNVFFLQNLILITRAVLIMNGFSFPKHSLLIEMALCDQLA